MAPARLVVFACAALLPAFAAAQVRLVSPSAGATVHENAGDVAVQVEGAAPGSQFQAVVDGEPRGEPQASPTFTLEGVDRGTHQLAVRVLDAQGREVARTEAVEVHVWQASRLFPSRRQGQ